MAITDPHDPREFRRYLSFNDDGSVAAVHEFESRAEGLLPAAVEVTNLVLIDFTALTIAPADVTALKAAVADVAAKASAVDVAVADLAASKVALQVSQAKTHGAVSVAAAKIHAAASVAADAGQ